MNALDVFLVAIAVLAAVGGYRLGFVARTLSWVGMAIGFVLAARALPWLVDQFDGSDPEALLLAAGLGLMVGAFLGQAVGLMVGSRLRIRLPSDDWRGADHVMGGAAGLIGVIAAFWLLLPTMAHAPGMVASQTRNSVVARTADRYLPEAPDTLVALRRIVGEDDFPQVFAALQPAPDLGPPPSSPILGDPLVAQIVPSTVKVTGVACSRVQEGSGFVVVGSDVVVTNAHVVAGHEITQVERDDGARLDATIVVFDPERDLAVLRVPGLDRAPLPIDDADIGDQGGIFGHPGGAPLRVAPFVVGDEVTAVGRDIYDRGQTTRDVLILSSSLRPGDSGGALIDESGAVVGVAFAVAPDDPDVAYALDSSELTEVLASGGDLVGAVPSGSCLR